MSSRAEKIFLAKKRNRERGIRSYGYYCDICLEKGRIRQTDHYRGGRDYCGKHYKELMEELGFKDE